MQFRDIEICLDMTNTHTFHPFEVVDGDTGNVLHITLQNCGTPMLLNECAICIAYTSSMGFAIQDETSGITLGTEAGTFSVLLNPQNYGPGNVSADVQVYSGPNRKVLITSKRFDFRCRSSLVSEEIIRANQAYPPLMAAMQEAVEATAAARAAAEQIALDKGELNVQADWTETDDVSDAYILHKPQVFAPAVHAASHAADGDDPVTPERIGAEPKRLRFANVTVAAEAFQQDGTYADYPLRADIALTDVTGDMLPMVLFAPDDAVTGNYAPVATCGNGTVSIYAAEQPVTALTLSSITLWNG